MATLSPITASLVGTTPALWTAAADGDLEVIASADDADYGYVAENVSGTYDQGYLLDNMPSDFGTMSFSGFVCRVRYGWSAYDGTLNTWGAIAARIITNDGLTVLAANDSGGSFRTLLANITNTTPATSTNLSFSYVNTTATKTDWDNARLELRITRTKIKGGTTDQQRIYAFEISGNYNIASGTAYNRSFSESLGIRELASGREIYFGRSYSDSIGLSDAFSRLVAYERSFAATLGLAEAFVIAQSSGTAFNLSIAESIGLAEAYGRIASYVRSLSDSFGLAEAFAVSSSGGGEATASYVDMVFQPGLVSANQDLLDFSNLVNHDAYFNQDLELWLLAGLDHTGYGTDTWRDISRYGRHGTLTNTPTWGKTNEDGRWGFLTLNDDSGAEDYVSVLGMAEQFGGKSAATVSLWWRPSDPASTEFVIDASLVFQIYSNPGIFKRLLVYIRDGVNPGLNPVMESGNDTYTLGEWIHIVATVTNGDQRLYANGVQVASNTATFTTFDTAADGYFRVGGSPVADGDYNDVRVWFKLFSADDAVALYRNALLYHPDELNRRMEPTPVYLTAASTSRIALLENVHTGILTSSPEFIEPSNPLADHPLNRDLEFWYLAGLDRTGYGSDTWRDLASKRDGTLINLDSTDWKRNDKDCWGELDFSSALNSSVLVESSTRLIKSLGSGTVIAVVIPLADSTEKGIYSEDIAAPGTAIQVLKTSTNVFRSGVKQFNEAWSFATGTTTITTGEMYHVAAVYGADNRLYVNGSHEATAAWDGTFTASHSDFGTRIGDYSNSGDFSWNRSIISVKVIGRVLSAEEIEMEYQQMLRFYPDLLNRINPVPIYVTAETTQIAIVDSGTDSINSSPEFIEWSNPVSSDPIHEGLQLWLLAGLDATGFKTETWRDLSKNKYEAVLTNMADPPSNWIRDVSTGRFGSLFLDGSAAPNGDTVKITSPTVLQNISGHITVTAWCYSTGLGSGDRIAVSMDIAGSDLRNWQLRLGDTGSFGTFTGTRFLIFQNGFNSNATSTDVLNDNEWYRIVGVYDRVSIRVYINGELAAETSVTGNIDTDAADLFVGSLGNENHYMKGYIDDVRVLDRAWTADEVLRDYNEGRQYYPSTLNRIDPVAFYVTEDGPLVQSKTGSSTATTVVITLDDQVRAGDLLVAMVQTDNSPESVSITDDQGNTWSLIESYTSSDPNAFMLYAFNCEAGPTTITVTRTSATFTMRVVIAEFTGIDPAPLDNSNIASGFGTAVNSGSITTGSYGELIVGGLVNNTIGNSGDIFTATPGNGWNFIKGLGNAVQLQYKVRNSGTYSFTGTFPSSRGWRASIASFTTDGSGVSAGTAYNLSLADSIGLALTFARQSDANRSLSENIAFLTNFQRLATISRSLSDTMGLADAVTLSLAAAGVFTIAVSDNLGMSDNFQRVANALRLQTDNLGISEDFQRVANTLRLQTDNLGTVDSVQRIATLFRSLQESAGLLDSQQRQVTSNRSFADTTAFVDNVQRIATVYRSLQESLGLSDDVTLSLIGAGVLTLVVTDFLGTSDSVQRQATIFRSLQDLFGLSDDVITILNVLTVFNIAVQDSLGMLDNVSRIANSSRAFLDELGIQDEYLRTVQVLRNLQDNLAVSDVYDRLVEAYRALADSLGLSEDLTREIHFARTLVDTIGALDNVDKTTDIYRSVTDYLGLSTNYLRIIEYGLGLTDYVGLTDDIDRQVEYVRSLVETIGLLEAFGLEATVVSSVVSAIDIFDALSQAEDTFDALSQATDIFDV